MLLLPSTYLSPIHHYALLMTHSVVYIDACVHYTRRAHHNRCRIATPNGLQSLTIPVEHPANPHTPIRDIRISTHHRWQRQHWQAILSAYRRTPYFDYYADDLAPHYHTPQPPTHLFDYNESLRLTILRLLDIHSHIHHTTTYQPQPPLLPPDPPISYTQAYQHRHGFLPHLSILDLLCNLGPTSLSLLDGGRHSY